MHGKARIPAMHGKARILVHPRKWRRPRRPAGCFFARIGVPVPRAWCEWPDGPAPACCHCGLVHAGLPYRPDLPPGDWWSLGILIRAGPFAAVAAAACLPTDEVIGRSFILQPERTTSVGAPFARAPFDVRSLSSLRTSGLYFTLCAALNAKG